MIIYTIKQNLDTMHEAFQNPVVVRRTSDGKETVEGPHGRKNIPDTATTMVIFKDENNRPIIGDIKKEDLQRVVKAFGFVNEEKKEPIKTADPSLGVDEFWNHKDLRMEIPHSGMELKVDSFENTPREAFWLSAMRANTTHFWINDGLSERPETLANVLFIVTPKHLESKRITDDIKSGSFLSSHEVSRTIMLMDRERKIMIVDALGEEYDDNFSDVELEKIIVTAIDKKPDALVYNTQRVDEFILGLAKATPEAFDLIKLIKVADKKNIIVHSGDQYFFNKVGIGHSLKQVEQNMQKVEYKTTLAALKKAVKDIE